MHRLMHLDLPRAMVLRALAGERRSDLEQAGQEYVENVLPKFANMKILALLEEYRDSGARLAIISASIDPVVKAVARNLEVDFYCSLLEYRGPFATGGLEKDLTGEKLSIVESLRNGDDLLVVTDNRTDLPLIRAADHAIVVQPHGRPATEWAGRAVDYVRP